MSVTILREQSSTKGRGALNTPASSFKGGVKVRWFRLYSELIDDPKVQRLPDELFKTWVNLLCLTCRCNGLLPVIEDIAFSLRLSLEETAKRINSLKAADLLESFSGDVLKPHNWNGRQYNSDVSTERVKRFRKRSRNVSVTPPDTDTDTDTEQKKKNPSSRCASTDSLFDKAYEQYPRHIGKRAAEKAWPKASERAIGFNAGNCNPQTLNEAQEFIYQRVMTYAAVCERAHKEKQFIPHMATWLNQDRFMDDPSEWAVTEKTNGTGTSKAERRNADISETTRSVFDPSKHIPGYHAKGLPDKTSG